MPNMLVYPLIRNVLSSTAKELSDIRAKSTGTVISGDTASRSGSFSSPSTLTNLRDAAISAIALTSSNPALNTLGQVGTAKAVSNIASSLPSAASDVASSSSSSASPSSSSAVSYPSDAGTSVTLPDYLNADVAKAYGMDASTAYQEALSNTSYQRAVSDLKAAGLNPALISGNFGGASSNVYGASLASNGISTGVSSAAGAHDWYKQLSNIGGLLGAGAALLTGSGLRGAYFGHKVGSAAGGAIGNLIDLKR